MLHLSLHPHTLQFKRPARTSRGAFQTRLLWFLRVWNDQQPEIVGWGECGPVPRLSVDAGVDFERFVHVELMELPLWKELSCKFGESSAESLTVNESTRRPVCHSRKNPQSTHSEDSYENDRSHHGVSNEVFGHLERLDVFAPTIQALIDTPIFATLPAFAFALETALLDLATGGQQRLFDTAFSRGEVGLTTHGLIWMDEMAGVIEQIERKVAQGFSVIKMKVGALPFADEAVLLREVRRCHPNIELRLDANGAFNLEDALPKLEELASVGVAFLEQPIQAGQWQAMAEICRQSPIPIGLDEELIGIQDPAQQRALVETIRPQHLILKPTLLGGFAACTRWKKLADAIGAPWWANSLLESNLGLNAICQWTSNVGGDRVHGLGTGQLFVENLQSPLRLKGAQMWSEPQVDWETPTFNPTNSIRVP